MTAGAASEKSQCQDLRVHIQAPLGTYLDAARSVSHKGLSVVTLGDRIQDPKDLVNPHAQSHL